MPGLSEEEIYRGLRVYGFPDAVARRRAREEAAGTPPSPTDVLQDIARGRFVTLPNRAILEEALDGPAAWPVRIRLPWSALCSDDKHYTATIVTLTDGRQVAKIVRRAEYRVAMRRIRGLAVAAWGEGRPACEIPVRLHAEVWVPDDRIHDVPNFAKCTHDALAGIVYTSDRWLYDARWLRAGADVDSPRAELTIMPVD